MTERTLLALAGLLAAAVWTGGLVTIAIVTRIARRQLPAAAQVEFFRALDVSTVSSAPPRW